MAAQIDQATINVKDAVKSLPKEDASLLYSQYVARFLSDNGRIWLTGSIMIPLALSGFALVSTINNPTFWRLVPVALVSTAIVLIWNWIADRHRIFQDRSMAWIVAIEEVLIERSGGSYPILTGFGSRRLSVRMLRWSFVAVVIFAWIIVIAAWSI